MNDYTCWFNGIRFYPSRFIKIKNQDYHLISYSEVWDFHTLLSVCNVTELTLILCLKIE